MFPLWGPVKTYPNKMSMCTGEHRSWRGQMVLDLSSQLFTQGSSAWFVSTAKKFTHLSDWGRERRPTRGLDPDTVKTFQKRDWSGERLQPDTPWMDRAETAPMGASLWHFGQGPPVKIFLRRFLLARRAHIFAKSLLYNYLCWRTSERLLQCSHSLVDCV